MPRPQVTPWNSLLFRINRSFYSEDATRKPLITQTLPMQLDAVVN
jgi:hypothetical protein